MKYIKLFLESNLDDFENLPSDITQKNWILKSISREDPRINNPKEYLDNIINEYKIILTDSKYQIQFYNSLMQQEISSDTFYSFYGNNRWFRMLPFDKNLLINIKNLNYRLQLHVILIQSEINLKLDVFPEYLEFIDRIQEEIKNYFTIECEDANPYCYKKDNNGNHIDNQMIYFYPKGTTNPTFKNWIKNV